jgi:hypothetical protein
VIDEGNFRPMTVLRVAVLLAFSCAAAASEPLPPPAGEPMLTVTGAVSVTNVDGAAVFDRAMLDALRQVSFVTGAIWTEGPETFTGPSLRAVLDRVGARGSAVRAIALNDYAITIPLSEIEDAAPIIASLRDGQPMTVRRHGPLWIVYPYDSAPRWRAEVIYSRSIWQLSRLDVLE